MKQQKPKKASEHQAFMDFWWNEVPRARGMKPVIVARDGQNVKRILAAGISRHALEQAATYFLNAPAFRKFSPSISTLLSAGVINGILNRMQNDERFWKELDGYLARRGVSPKLESFAKNLAALKNRLSVGMGMPRTETND